MRPTISSLRRHKTSVSLIVIEIALTCFIAINAAFVIGRMVQRAHIDSGVAEHQLVVVTATQGSTHAGGGKARMQAELTALRRIPGVRAVSAVNQYPFGGSRTADGIRLSPDQDSATLAAARYLGHDLIGTLGLKLAAGRDFRPGEYIDSGLVQSGRQYPTTTIITSTLARRLWPDEPALGKTFYIGHPVRVVGIVAGLLQPANLGGPTAQFSMLMPVRMTTPNATFLLRTAPERRERVLKAAVATLKHMDPRRIFLRKDTLDRVRADAFRKVRSIIHVMIVIIAALLLVTALGIVGLASFWVTQRRHSIGVRRALGATRRDILRYFQTENFLIVTLGIVIGMVLAYGVSLVAMLHFHVPLLPWSYLPVGAAVLWLLGQVAVLGPALRASHVPPVVATRSV